MELQKKIDELGNAWESFKTINDEKLSKLAKGEAVSELEQKLAKNNENIEKLQNEIKAMSAALNRGTAGGHADADAERKTRSMAESKAMHAYMRRGDESEFKALSSNSDPDGGYLVRDEVSSEIVKKVWESSPLRQLASQQTISGSALEILQDLDEADAEWVAETGTRSTTGTPQLKKIIIPAHEIAAKPKATQTILDDAGVNLETWLQDKVVEKFGRMEASAFISGNGVGKPMGILSYAAGTGFNQLEQVNTGAAAAVAAAGLLSIQTALKEPYQANAHWLFKRATVGSIRGLKDENEVYVWQPGLLLGKPDMILGRPVMYADDFEAEGAGNLIGAYGDFKAGYQIVDRMGIRVLRDPYSAKPYVEFYTTKRVGGAVKNFEAIKILKCST